jgi:cation transport protein ChaC
MPTGVYDPKWLKCVTPEGPVRALAFTLSRRSPNFTGELSDERYRHIFTHAVGRYGSSLDYARQTLLELRRHSIHDAALARLVALAHERQEQQEQHDREAQQAQSGAAADCGTPPAPVYVPGSPDKKTSSSRSFSSQQSSGPSKEKP